MRESGILAVGDSSVEKVLASTQSSAQEVLCNLYAITPFLGLPGFGIPAGGFRLPAGGFGLPAGGFCLPAEAVLVASVSLLVALAPEMTAALV